jgi:flagellar hook assembly protein FlgD
VGFKIIANSIYIPQGERGCMPVTVNDFDNMVSMQWALHWDNTVLNYECTRRYNIPGLSGNDIALSQVAGATLVMAWSDPNAGATGGVTVPDGTRIVDICFKAIAAPGAASTITIDGLGIPPSAGGAEAFNAASVDVWTKANHPNGASGVSNTITVNPNPVSPFDVTYTVDKIDAAPNAEGCVSVRVKNFTAMTASEFALSYNPTELTYVKTEFLPNPLNLVLATNITHVANPGVIKFRWDNTNGATVATDEAIFKSCFTVIAPAGTTSNIAFTTTPCPAPMCTMCTTITGMGNAKATGGVPMGRVNGWIKSVPTGPNLVPTHVKCFGGATGSIALDNPPSTTATAYVWAGPGINGANQGMEDPTGLIAGTYTVTVTYSNATTGTRSTTINQPTAALAQTNTVNSVSCFLGTNGAINLTPTGGESPYTYLWSNGATVQDPTGLAVDFYSVTTTDANACTLVTANIVVTGFSEIKLPNTAANLIITQPTCAGLSNGSIDVNPTGGAGGYTYLWTGGTTGKQLANKPAGSYAVTVTDINGCSKVFSNLSIPAPQPLTCVLVGKTDVKCAGSATGSADLTLGGGTGALSVCWSTGPGPCVSTMPDPNNLPAGTYTPIVTDEKGCTTTITNVVIAAPTNGALVVNGTGTSAQCFGQNTGSITLNVSGGWAGAYTYQWDNTNPSLPDPPSVKDPMNVPPSVYIVTVTDSGQCTNTQSVTVGGPQTDITAATTLTNVKCFGSSDGSIDLNLTGGNGGPYTVIWSNTTLAGETISGLAPGTYQPTVTDNSLVCTKVLTGITVTGPLELSIDTTIAAANPTNGSITLAIISGGTPTFSYLWSNGATTKDLSNLSVGTYTVTITDANNCVRTYSFSVPSGNVLGGIGYTTTPSCNEDGCINLMLPPTASGQAPFTLNWGGIGGPIQVSTLTPSICSLKSGVYNVTVTAVNGNSVVITAIEIKQSDPASVDVNTTNPFSGLVKNGKITLTPAQGVICNLQYQWGPLPLNSTTNEVTNLGQGTYFVTITNPCSGCTSVRQFTLVYSPLTFGAIVVVNPDCSNNPTGSINHTVQGGNPPYTFAWTGPNGYTETTEDVTGLFPGVYTVVATDLDNRTETKTYTLTSQSNLNITNVNETSLYGPFQVSGATVCDGVASVVFTAGAGSPVIEWSNGATGVNNTTLCGGPYSVTITDAAGCETVWSDSLTAPSAIEAPQTSVGVKCNEDCNGTAQVSPKGGVGPYTVSWSTGQVDPIVFANGFSKAVNLCGGDYSVTVTDKNNVNFVLTVNVPEPAPIEALFAATAPRNFNACDGDILINVTGATAPITYVWSGSFGHTGDGERAEELCSGEFVQFLITDANGCTAYATDSVPYPEDGCFRVSPVITPGQQDGKNDFVIITCIETALENHMEIYNRWGQLVFESDNYSNNDVDLEHNWNGLNSSGAALAEGVYYYVLTFSYLDDQGNTQEGTRKGAINLLR